LQWRPRTRGIGALQVPVTPRFHGYGDVTATYIRKFEVPSRIYAKHQYRQESEYGSKGCIIYSNKWVHKQSYHQSDSILHEYYITDMLKCGNTRKWIKDIYMNRTIECSRDSWRSTLPLRTLISNRTTLPAPEPGHKNPGESVKLPRRVWYKARWRARVSTNMNIIKDIKFRRQGLEHKYNKYKQVWHNHHKTGNPR